MDVTQCQAGSSVSVENGQLFNVSAVSCVQRLSVQYLFCPETTCRICTIRCVQGFPSDRLLAELSCKITHVSALTTVCSSFLVTTSHACSSALTTGGEQTSASPHQTLEAPRQPARLRSHVPKAASTQLLD